MSATTQRQQPPSTGAFYQQRAPESLAPQSTPVATAEPVLREPGAPVRPNAADADDMRAPEIRAHADDANELSPVASNGKHREMTGPQRRLFEANQQPQRQPPQRAQPPLHNGNGALPPPPPLMPQSPFAAALQRAVQDELLPLGQSIVNVLRDRLIGIAKRIGVREEVRFSDQLPLHDIPRLFEELGTDVSFGYAARCYETLCKLCACDLRRPAELVSHAVAAQERALREQWRDHDQTALLLELAKKTELERDILDASEQAIEHHRMMVRFRKSALGQVRDALAFLFDEGGEVAAREFAVPRVRATGSLASPPSPETVASVLRKRRRGIDATWMN